MSEETKRTVRSVLCQDHGLRYDPAVASGCARCKKWGPTPQKTGHAAGRGSAKLLRLLLVIAALLVALWVFLGNEPFSFLSGNRETRPKAIATESVNEDPYDEPYEDPYEEADEDGPPPSGAISGTAEELQEGARVHQERVKAYENVQ